MRHRLVAAAATLLVVALLAAPAAADRPIRDLVESIGLGNGEPVRPAFGDESSPIRPGAALRSSQGSCTFSFIFHQVVYATPTNPFPVPDVYIGTAAHCTAGVGERVTLPGLGEIGTVAYDSDQVGSRVDFSLVRLDPGMVGRANPKMLGNEGPRGVIAVSELQLLDRINLHGYGIGVSVSPLTRNRFGYLVGWNDREYVADMPAVNGDSGAPLLHHRTGKALGIVSRYGFTAMPPSTDTGPLMPWIHAEIAAAGFGGIVVSTV